MRIALVSTIALVLIANGLTPVFAGYRVEAEKNKVYTISKEHGPWMIMVASFSRVRDESLQTEGLSPREAAMELMYRLRKAGIPAYVFEQQGKVERIATQNRMQQAEERIYAAQRGMICVLAGNYTGSDADDAKRTLDFVKKFDASFLLDQGGRFKPTPGQPTPLSGAFLTINPLLTPEEVQAASIDPLLVKLNTQYDHSLFENKGQYTLVIATFSGKSSRYATEDQEKSILDSFTISNSLDQAASDAWKMTDSMRNATKFGYDENLEAFLWHDRHKSIVTIGSFDSPDDPRIPRLIERFSAKQKSLQANPNQQVLVAEYFSLPKVNDVTQAKQYWLFDPNPRLIKVPRSRR